MTATDKASTAALAAQVVDNGVAAAGEGEEGTKPAATIAAPVPHGSLVPLHLNPDPNPTFDVDALPIKDADGNDLFDLDLDALEEKPWRQPGANLADYFNYGMNEATWKNYVRKQREMRKSESVAANPFAVRSSPVLSSSSFAGVQIFHDTDPPPPLFFLSLRLLTYTYRGLRTATTSHKPGPTSRARTRPSSSRPSWVSNLTRCPPRLRCSR